MGKMGFHFRRHGFHGHKSVSCHGPSKWSRGMTCLRKGQRSTEPNSGRTNHNTCTRHHHPNKFQKWCSGDWKRKCHHFNHGHVHHYHGHQHGHHNHSHCHGNHQSHSQHNMEKHRKGCAQGHSHECCTLESQTKACQTDAVLDEAPQSDHPVDTEIEDAPTSA